MKKGFKILLLTSILCFGDVQAGFKNIIRFEIHDADSDVVRTEIFIPETYAIGLHESHVVRTLPVEVEAESVEIIKMEITKFESFMERMFDLSGKGLDLPDAIEKLTFFTRMLNSEKYCSSETGNDKVAEALESWISHTKMWKEKIEKKEEE